MSRSSSKPLNRNHFLSRRTVIGSHMTATGAPTTFRLSACGASVNSSSGGPGDVNVSSPAQPKSSLKNIGDLHAPDINDVTLPQGFISKIIAPCHV